MHMPTNHADDKAAQADREQLAAVRVAISTPGLFARAAPSEKRVKTTTPRVNSRLRRLVRALDIAAAAWIGVS